MGDLDQAISQAFVRYSPSANWQTRIGRMPISLFHYTEYRDIGFALTWAKVPNEIYGIVPYRFLEGADLTYQNQLGSSTFRAKMYYGTSKADIGNEGMVEEVRVERAYGASFELDTGAWLFEANYSLITIENNNSSIDQVLQGIAFIGATAPAAWPDSEEFAADFTLESQQGAYASVSVHYTADSWKVESEFARIRADSILTRPVDSQFISYTYRFEDWSLFSHFSARTGAEFLGTDPEVVSLVVSLPCSTALTHAHWGTAP